MTDIFDELNEDLRAEKARALALRYGGLATALLVVALAGAGAWQGWRWHQERESARAATPYLAAMAAADALPLGPAPGRAAAAEDFAKVAATAPAGYRTLARLREAGLRADAGDLPAALALYDAVAQDGAADPMLRDLANLLWAQRQVDSGDPAAVAARLQPLEAAGNPWRPLAQEAAALLALRRDDTATALAMLRTLASDPAAAEGVRGRANGLLTLLGDTEARG